MDKNKKEERQTLSDSLSAAAVQLASSGNALRATGDIREFHKKLIYTQLIEADLILKLGFGSRIQLLGDFSAGKTLLSYKLIASAQKTCRQCITPIIDWCNDKTGEVKTTCLCGKNDKMVCVYVDLENEFDPAWASAWGVELGDTTTYKEVAPGVFVAPDTKFVIARLENLDSLTVVLQNLIAEGAVDLVVVDSIAAPQTKESGQGKDQPGTRARAVSKIMAAINSASSKCWIKYGSCPTTVFPNQYRMKIGGLSPMADPRVAAGGLNMGYTSVQTVHLTTAYKSAAGGFQGVKSFGETTAKIKKDKFSGDMGAEAQYRVYLKPMKVSRVEYKAGDTDEGSRLWSFIRELGEGGLGDKRWFHKDSKGYHVLGRTFANAMEIQQFLSRRDIGYLLRLPIFAMKFSPQMRQHLKRETFDYTPFRDEPILELIDEATQQIGSNAAATSSGPVSGTETSHTETGDTGDAGITLELDTIEFEDNASEEPDASTEE